MSQPPEFTITVVFANDEANQVSGRAGVRTASLDALFSSLKSFSDAVRTNLALIQRDDGEILDAKVKVHTLSSDVLSLIASGAFTVRGAWVTSTVYAVGNLVAQGGSVYLCIVAHTSGVFATDLSSGDWVLFTTTASAANASFAPTSSLSSTTVQAAIEELDGDLRNGVNLFLHNSFGGIR